jgi:hypothetical protein
MSNVQRQRKFRAAHPGYFRKYRTRTPRRSEQVATFLAQVAAAEATMAAAALAAAEAGTGGGEAASMQCATPGSQVARKQEGGPDLPHK